MRALALLFTLHFGDEHPSGDRWFAPDKAKHFFMSAFIQSASFSALRLTGARWTGSIAGASAMTAIVGVGKELHDARTGGDASFKDLTWDAAGAAGASVLLHQTER
jgi:putative lipoprotein